MTTYDPADFTHTAREMVRANDLARLIADYGHDEQAAA